VLPKKEIPSESSYNYQKIQAMLAEANQLLGDD
jgi:hypothetical protein